MRGNSQAISIQEKIEGMLLDCLGKFSEGPFKKNGVLQVQDTTGKRITKATC